MRNYAREWGENDPRVQRSKTTYWYIKRIVVTFFIGEILCNLIKPIIYYLANAVRDDDDGDGESDETHEAYMTACATAFVV